MAEYDHPSQRPHATSNGPSAAEALKSTDAAAESAPSGVDPQAAGVAKKSGLPTAPLGPVSSGSAKPSGGPASSAGFPGPKLVTGSAPKRR